MPGKWLCFFPIARGEDSSHGQFHFAPSSLWRTNCHRIDDDRRWWKLRTRSLKVRAVVREMEKWVFVHRNGNWRRSATASIHPQIWQQLYVVDLKEIQIYSNFFLKICRREDCGSFSWNICIWVQRTTTQSTESRVGEQENVGICIPSSNRIGFMVAQGDFLFLRSTGKITVCRPRILLQCTRRKLKKIQRKHRIVLAISCTHAMTSDESYRVECFFVWTFEFRALDVEWD